MCVANFVQGSSVVRVWPGCSPNLRVLVGLFRLFLAPLAACLLATSGARATEDYEVPAHAYLATKNLAGLESGFGEMFRLYREGKISDESVYRSLDRFTLDATDGQEALFDAWVAAYPKSYVALTARGYYYRGKAGRIRGGKYARETSAVQFAGHNEYMTKARSDLLKAAELDPKPTLSYLRLITIAGSTENLAQAKRMREMALKADPKSMIAHRVYLKYAAPKWQGSIAELAAAERDAAASAMSETDKRRYRAYYYYMVGDEMDRIDKPDDAIDMFWRAHREGAEKENYNALERGAWVAEKNLKYDEAMKFLDELLATSKSAELWARKKRGYILETQFGKLDKAFADYSVAVELGDGWAETRLGWWYDNGIHVPRDEQKARELWQRAARKGNRTAIQNLEGKNKKAPTID